MTRLFCFFCCILLLTSCAGPGQQVYETGQKLQHQQKYTEAIKFYTSALEQEPDNKEYRQALQQVQKLAAKELLSQASKELEPSHLTLQQLHSISRKLDQAVSYDDQLKEAHHLQKQVDERIQQTEESLRQRYQQARELLEQEQYQEATQHLRAINQVFRNYEDVNGLLQQAKTQGIKRYLTQGALYYKENNYPQALESFNSVLFLDADNVQAQRFQKLSQQRNNPEFFIQQSQQLLREQQIVEAHQIIEQAITLFGPRTELLQQQTVAAERLTQQQMRQVELHYQAQRPFLALQTLDELLRINPNLAADLQTYQLKNSILQLASNAAAQHASQEKYGNAYQLLTMIEQLNPSFPNLFYRLQEAGDKIRRRVRKSIAIMDFSNPSHDQDAGQILSSALTTYLFKTAGADIQILERSDIQPLLEEMNLSQTGMFDLQMMQNSSALSGIDYFIFGSVLNYTVSTDRIAGKRYAKFQIGTKIRDNIDFLNWKARHPNPSEEALAKAPVAVVEVPEFKEVQYDVTTIRKIAFVDIFYKMIDTRRAEILFTRSHNEKLPKEDEYVSGIPEAGVKSDPLEIATDREMLQQLTQNQVSCMGTDILDRLQGLQLEYFRQGEKLLERKEYEAAVEAFYDAIFDEEIKGLQTDITKQSQERIVKALVARESMM